MSEGIETSSTRQQFDLPKHLVAAVAKSVMNEVRLFVPAMEQAITPQVELEVMQRTADIREEDANYVAELEQKVKINTEKLVNDQMHIYEMQKDVLQLRFMLPEAVRDAVPSSIQLD